LRDFFEIDGIESDQRNERRSEEEGFALQMRRGREKREGRFGSGADPA
jgi:hypothetical protein